MCDIMNLSKYFRRVKKMNKEKYRNAILFFAENVPNLGKVKLNKLLYFLDFDHFEKHGVAVTEDTYENNDLGPVPQNVEQTIAEMRAEGLVDIIVEPVIDYVIHRLVSSVHHKPDIFRPTEMEMLCEVTGKWARHTAKEIVIASHGEAPWIATQKGESIPYALAYYRGKYEQPSYDEESKDGATLTSDTQDY